MDKQESGFRVVLVLVIIALFSAMLLAYVNKVTLKPIEENKRAEIKKAVRLVLAGSGAVKYAQKPDTLIEDGSAVTYFTAKNENGMIAGYALAVKAPNGFSSDFDLMVGLDSSGTILDTYVLEHKETPGLGDKMRTEKFKGQFRGKNLASTKWQVKKDGGDIDAITAATITSRAFTGGVVRALKTFKTIQKGKK